MGLVNTRNGTILVACGDQGDRQQIGSILKSSGFSTVLLAGTAQACIQEVKKRPVDVLVAGLDLPDIPSLDLIRAIRGGSKRMLILACSSEDSDENKKEATGAGANSYLPIPVAQDRLLKLIDDHMLAKMGIVSGSIAVSEEED